MLKRLVLFTCLSAVLIGWGAAFSLHAQTAARNELTRLDDEEPEEIERHRAVERAND